MLKEIAITENQIFIPDDNIFSELEKAKLTDTTLPYTIKNKSIVFDDYIIGSIQIGDITIKILPRNSAFDLNKLFEMIIYTDFSFLKEESISGFGLANDFGVNVLIKSFIEQTRLLCLFGLTGDYTQNTVRDKYIYGDINFDSYQRRLLPIEGIETTQGVYNLDIVQNQIIKKALYKCLNNLTDVKLRTEIILISKHFSGVRDYIGEIRKDKERVKNFFSANKNYPLCLELAISILSDFKVVYSNSNMAFRSFLFNSNDIFEKYIRALLARNLNLSVLKLNSEGVPITTPTKSLQNFSLNKFLLPDIIIDYQEKYSQAAAILDVKNKPFNPSDNGNFSDLISSSDLYQIIVYCLKFNTNVGGLIYPADKEFSPISFNADVKEILNITLFSINMSESMPKRHKTFLSNIKKHLVDCL